MVIFMREIWWTIRFMEMVFITILEDLYIVGNFWKGKQMVWVERCGQKDLFMRDNLKMVKSMDKAFISGVRVVLMKENGLRIWFMAKGDMNGQMVG